jgi:hypothetical protein
MTAGLPSIATTAPLPHGPGAGALAKYRRRVSPAQTAFTSRRVACQRSACNRASTSGRRDHFRPDFCQNAFSGPVIAAI